MKVLETFAPVGSGIEGGAAAIVQSYEPIERDAQRALLWVGGVLQGLLLVLFLVFVPLLARVSRRVGSQIEKIHFQGFYDEVTGLPNRPHLRERLDLAISRVAPQGHHLAVLLVGLDGFREINDTLGHDAGDAVLRDIGARLEALVDGEPLLARAVGDEFAIVFEYFAEDEVAALGSRIRSRVERPIELDGVRIAVDASIGIALYPQHGEDAQTLLRHAEVALHAAKQRRVGLLMTLRTTSPGPAQRGLPPLHVRNRANRGIPDVENGSDKRGK